MGVVAWLGDNFGVSVQMSFDSGEEPGWPTGHRSDPRDRAFALVDCSFSLILSASLMVSFLFLHRQLSEELAENGPEAFPDKGHQTQLEEENRRFKCENELSRQEIIWHRKTSFRLFPGYCSSSSIPTPSNGASLGQIVGQVACNRRCLEPSSEDVVSFITRIL